MTQSLPALQDYTLRLLCYYSEDASVLNKIQAFEEMAVKKGVAILQAGLKDEPKDEKSHIFVVLGASVSLASLRHRHMYLCSCLYVYGT